MERIADGIAATWSKALYRDWNGSVHVQNVSFGSWAPRPDCPTPRLWVLLTGHTRTFAWTRDALAEVANLSSLDCYFVVAAVPAELDASVPTGFWSPQAELWKLFGFNHNSVANGVMGESAECFGGHLGNVTRELRA